MERWTPTRLEWGFIICCGLFWAVVIAILPPAPGGTDAYLFRDAACNLLAGQGFRTASFEHSGSFSPLLYSNYTPGTLWAFAVAAKFLGTGTLVARIYPHLWALVADIVVLFAGLRFLSVYWQRWAFLALLGLVLPFGAMGPLGERPEPVSFAVLMLLLVALRRPPGAGAAALAGFLGGAAFLCEPFAGVVAVLLIAGRIIVSFFPGGEAGNFSRATGVTRFNAFAAQSALAALMFALPVAVTAGAFYQRDSHSLERFWRQATVAGVGRAANYAAGEESAANTASAATAAPATQHPSLMRKYREAWGFHRAQSAVHLFEIAIVVLIGLIWIVLLIGSQGPGATRFGLLLAGLVCFALPVAIFPLQGNYLTLTRLLLPVLLASNWASVRTSLWSADFIPMLLAINLLAAAPASGVTLLTSFENRASYRLAQGQVSLLRKNLEQHPLNGKVALVPSSHYFLYKDVAGNIYNPGYLSYREDPAQVGAVVNCYLSTADFQPGTLPLPAFVAAGRWQRISTAQDAVTVSVFGHRLMSRNWGLGCDIYVTPAKDAP